MPQYSIITSEEYHGFLEVRARTSEDSFVPIGHSCTRVERVEVTVIGEQDTPVYGVTETVRLNRDKVVPHIGMDGWLWIVCEPKLTATAWVLAGGEAQDLGCGDGSSELAKTVGGDLSMLVPDVQAATLAAELVECGLCPEGMLYEICMARGFLEMANYEDEAALEDVVSDLEDLDNQTDDGVDQLNTEEEQEEDDEENLPGHTEMFDGGAAGAGVSSHLDSVQAMRRRLARMILSQGASPEAAKLFESLHNLEANASNSNDTTASSSPTPTPSARTVVEKSAITGMTSLFGTALAPGALSAVSSSQPPAADVFGPAQRGQTSAAPVATPIGQEVFVFGS